MWQRFTERARRVILLGQEEAGKANSGYVGTRHLLLGLVREKDGVAGQVLQKMGITLEKVRQEIADLPEPQRPQNYGDPKLTPKAKRVLELAADEARRLRHNYIGTEHLLLALLREKDNSSTKVLRRLGLNLEKARQEISMDWPPDDAAPVIAAPTVTDEVINQASAQAASPVTRITSDFHFTPETMLLLFHATVDAKKAGETLLTPQHLVRAMIENADSEAAQFLQTLGLDLEKAREMLRPTG